MTVSIPAIEATDGSDTRWALETARTLWTQGERREALQWIRRAAEAAAEAGQDNRALGLAKMGAELRGALDIPRTLPPPPVEAAPVEIPRAPAAPQVEIPRAPAAPQVEIPRAPAAPAAAAPAAEVPQTAAAAPVAQAQQVVAAAAPVPQAAAVAPAEVRRASAPPLSIPPPSERGASELVVTLVSSDGDGPAPDAAIVSHRAIRVAVLPGADPTQLRVSVLKPGQVAPREAVVSLLVSLEPGASPVPAT